MQFPIHSNEIKEENDLSFTHPCDNFNDISVNHPCDNHNDDESSTQEVFPRIGADYQAVIPPQISSGDSYQERIGDQVSLWENNDTTFLEGLPVPTMWMAVSFPNCKTSESCLEYELLFDASVNNVGISSEKLENGQGQWGSPDLPDSMNADKHDDTDIVQVLHGDTNFTIAERKDECTNKLDSQESTVVDSIDTDVSEAVPSMKWQRKKRGRGGWKKLKRPKFEFSKSSKQKHDVNAHNEHGSNNLIMVPGSSCESWTVSEEDAFILALYIFGKNFVAVQKFMGSKTMMDILTFYYGKFYGTDPYCRWAESRKVRSRKCFQGQRIFSGWRQNELSVRLLPHVPDRLKDKLPSVMREFNEGKTPIQDFVKELKALVGLDILIQAVGIGKGNHDLTAALMDPMKGNQPAPSRGEIPMGRACSSLSTGDIIKFLTGDYRLSKARANDLFWEAVWPRLLASGWHSEQPDDEMQLHPKNSLVFLVPGVQKFSRKVLVKGVDYFDSVSEVLNKVSVEPSLLDPSHFAKGDFITWRTKSECQWRTEVIDDQKDQLQHAPRYLQPRSRSINAASYIFTIVDTSLAPETKDASQIRESRTLPVDEEMEVQGPSHLEELPNTWRVDDVPIMNNGRTLGTVDKQDIAHKSLVDGAGDYHGDTSFCKHSLLSISKEEPLSPTIKKTVRNWDLNKVENDNSFSCQSIQIANGAASDENINATKNISHSFAMETALANDDRTEYNRLDSLVLAAELSLLDNSPHIASLSMAAQQKNEKDSFYSQQKNSGSKVNLSSVCDLQRMQKIFSEMEEVRLSSLFLNENCKKVHEDNGPDSAVLTEQTSDSNLSKPLQSSCVNNGVEFEGSFNDVNLKNCKEQNRNKPQTKSADQTTDNSLNDKFQGKTGSAEGRRQSTRARPLTMKALEAYAAGFYSNKRRKGSRNADGMDESHIKFFSRQFTDEHKTVLKDSPSDQSDFTVVDTSMDPEEEGNHDSEIDNKRRSRFKKRRKTYMIMKLPKSGQNLEQLGPEIRENVISGIFVPEASN